MVSESAECRLDLVALRDFPLIQPGDDLAWIIRHSLDLNGMTLEDGDILVITQKITVSPRMRQSS
jgi:coenzyme F420-0:L-glutamate ligase/coenzyme F420-1:gamma-L-glutamate ligase